MKPLAHKISGGKRVTLILLLLLPTLAIGCTYLIVKMGNIPPMLFAVGVTGMAIVIFSMVYPEFGLYMCVVTPYFLFAVIRFLNTDAPLGIAIDAMVWITFIGVVIRMRAKHEPFWRDCNNAIVFIYLLVQVYSVFQRVNPNGGQVEMFVAYMKRNMSIFLFFYCALQIFRDVKSIRRFFYVWLLLSFLGGAYACWEEWVGMPKFELNYILSDPLRESLSSLDNGNYRKASFMAGPTDFGLSMTGTIIMTIVFYLRLKTSRWKKTFLLVSTILMTIAMAYSGTRTATFMLVLEVFLYILMTINEKKTLVFSVACALIGAFVLFAPIYGNGTINRLRSTFQISTDASLQVRDVNRHIIQPYIYTHPIGGGIGTTGVLNIQKNAGHPLAGFPTDSGLLQIVLEQGWIGLILSCLSYFVILKQSVQSYFRTRNPEFKVIYLAITGCIFGFVFAQYAQVAIGQMPNGFLFVGLMAVLIRLNDIEKKAILENKLK
jgi:putative inorganic carbon (HCO3(-)) transporter